MAFVGFARKLALVLIILSAVGWLLFVVGFGLQKFLLEGHHHYPQDIPNWITAFLGPVLYVSGLAHAAGRWKSLSAVAGIAAVCFGVTYLVADGYVVVQRAIEVHEDYDAHSRKETDHLDVPTWTKLQLSGGLIAGFSWAAVLLMIWPRFATLSSLPPAQPELPPAETERVVLFAGYARKAAVPCIVISAVAWLLFLVGVTLEDDNTSHRLLAVTDVSLGFSYWAVCLVGAPMYVAALSHAAFSQKQPSVLVGALTAILSTLYVTSLGYVLTHSGKAVTHCRRHLRFNTWAEREVSSLCFQFDGGLISGFFWAISVALWPYYSILGSPHTRFNERELEKDIPVVPPFRGFARKLAVVNTVLSFCAWLPMVIGLGEGILDSRYFDYVYWVIFIIGPVMYMVAFMHLALPPPYMHFAGAITGFLSVLYFVSVGVVLHTTGAMIHTADLIGADIQNWVYVQFVSTLIACVCWGVALASWPAFVPY